MTADALATCIARSSAAMVLTMEEYGFWSSMKKGLNYLHLFIFEKCWYIFYISYNNSAHKGLISFVSTMILYWNYI